VGVVVVGVVVVVLVVAQEVFYISSDLHMLELRKLESVCIHINQVFMSLHVCTLNILQLNYHQS
jgi:hypothetical protein